MKRKHALTIEHNVKPGLHRDSDVKGLYLKVTEDGTKSWVFRFMLNKRARAMGLGPYPLIKLAEARDLAIDARRLLVAGKDPIAAREEERKQQQRDQAKRVAFKDFADEFVETKKAEWKGNRHYDQWKQSLTDYVYPLIGELPVPDIDRAAILKVLQQPVGEGTFWEEKTVTASRVRERIAMTLDAATVKGLREGSNPAAWDGNLEHVLPSPSKIHVTRHHRALEYADVPTFMIEVANRKGVVARAFQFLTNTATRTNETVGARWGEIDYANRLWVIPWYRVKKRKQEHGPFRVPLNDIAMAIIDAQQAERRPDDEYVFPGNTRHGGPISESAMEQMCLRMKCAGSPHGMRAAFRTWAEETTDTQDKVIKATQAHAQGKLEAAYQRGDLLAKRRKLMDAWGCYIKHGAAPELRLAS